MYILFLFAERSMKHSRFFWWFVLFWTSLHENWFGTCWNRYTYFLGWYLILLHKFISQHYQDLAIDLVTSGPVKIAALSSWLCSISQEIDHVFRHRCLDQRKRRYIQITIWICSSASTWTEVIIISPTMQDTKISPINPSISGKFNEKMFGTS